MTQPYAVLADVVLSLHFAVVVFVVGGALAVLVGGLGRWAWVRAPRWRWLHLGAIGFVVVQTWLGQYCPLTILEAWLRMQAHGAGYERSFIEYWLQRWLYYEAPGWVFSLAYSLFGLLVLALWRWFPPRTSASRKKPVHNQSGKRTSRGATE